MPREIVNSQPWNQCFGCGQRNEQGLRLTFMVLDDGTVEARYEVAEHLVGPPGTVHGGIQAVLLDEVLGMTARLQLAPVDEAAWAVTAELSLSYRKPVPVAAPLVIRGRLLRKDGPNLFVGGEIVGPDEEVMTTAEARFRSLGGPPV